MKKGGKFFLYLVFVFLSLIFGNQALCYDTNIAHPGIAGLAAKVYNKNNTKKITAEQYNWILQGAIDEDMPTRWLNHFYDPIYNRGLWFFTQHDSSKVWSNDASAQQSYSLGDFTWQRAINDYRRGNLEAAFRGLGHNIHLVSDLFVPAHTRDDIHAPKPDSYEDFVKQNWIGVAPAVSAVTPIYKNSVDSIFDEAANFSNNNFYSDDTIESGDYKSIRVEKIIKKPVNGDIFYVAQSSINNSFYNLFLSTNLDWKNSPKTLNDSSVLSDYSTQLLPKAVGYSAGMISLFLDEVEKNQTDSLPYFKENISGYINSIFGLAINSAEKIYQSNSSNAAQSNSVINNTVDSLVKDVENFGKTVVQKTPVESAVLEPSVIAVPLVKKDTTVVKVPVESNQINPVQPNKDTSSTKLTDTNPYGYGFGSVQVIVSSTLPTSTSSTPSDYSSSTDPNLENNPVSSSTDSNTSTDSNNTTTTPDNEDGTDANNQGSTDIGDGDNGTPTSTDSIPDKGNLPDEDSSEPVADVVINEIAWAGTSADTVGDQYIELYNNTESPIKLFSYGADSWQIKINDKKISILNIKNDTIPAKSFYLLERKDDRAVSEIAADVLYDGIFSTAGDKVELLSPSSTIVDYVDGTSGWPAGSAVTFSSMERINTKISGSSTTNWQTNKGPRLEGKVRNGGSVIPLNGSPKQSNFGSIVLMGTQTVDNMVLSVKSYPYILQDYIVPVGKTLTIKPGVKILGFASYSKLDIYGELDSVGSQDEKISFGSYQNNPKEKDWLGLILRPGSKAEISNADIQYAGSNYFLNGYIWTQPVSRAIFSDKSELTLSDVNFNNNGSLDLFLDSASTSISNCGFYNGGRAIESYNGYLSLENSAFDNFSNTEGVIYIKGIWPEVKDLSLSNNAANYLFIYLAEINHDVEVKNNIPMVWSYVTVGSEANVNVEEGSRIMMPILGDLYVKGNLNLNGSVDNPVSITTIGDLNNNYWGRIVIDGGRATFNSANIKGGTGVFRLADSLRGMIVVKSGQLNMDGTQVLDGRQSGNEIQIIDGEVSIKDSSIGYLVSKPAADNTNGIRMDGGSLSLDNTTFLNLDYAINTDNEELPPLYFNNMGPENFQSVGTPWFPAFWYFDPLIWVGSMLPPL